MLLRTVRKNSILLLKSIRRNYNRNRYKLREYIQPCVVQENDFLRAFKEIGLANGSAVIVHSSMSSFGNIAGGPRTVIKALEKILLPDGLIVMPAYPLTSNMFEHLQLNLVFDIGRTPSKMGAVTEEFRKSNGVFRSLHPTHSVCAKGKGALEFVSGHERCLTPFSTGSPFSKLVEMNATLLLLGVGFGPVTIYHEFEDRLGSRFPFKVYLDDIYTSVCINDKGKRIIVRTLCHDPKMGAIRIDHRKQKATQFRKLLKQENVLSEVTVGRGTIACIALNDLMNKMDKFLKNGITIYDA